VFSEQIGGVTVTEAGVPLITGTVFRTYVETDVDRDSGIAIANPTGSNATVTFELTNLDGSPVDGVAPQTASLPPSGQMAMLNSNIFPNLPASFKGILRVSSSSPALSIVGLRIRVNERGEYLTTTVPVTNEANPPAAGTLVFPHFVDGAGYTTEFILFSGSAGQNSTGELQFMQQLGGPLTLGVN
jgi:hypothetical protein